MDHGCYEPTSLGMCTREKTVVDLKCYCCKLCIYIDCYITDSTCVCCMRFKVI